MASDNSIADTVWSSRLGFILASASSAIGLGAIWKFPFWAGTNGGAAFIVPFLVFTFTIGIVLVMAECAMGRAGRGSAVHALKKVGGPFFGIVGGIAVLNAYIILTYYSVIGGWCVSYLFDSFAGNVVNGDPKILSDHFKALVGNGTVNVFFMFLYLTATCAVVALGVEKGIEKIAKYLMPLLFILMIFIIIRSLMMPGSWEGMQFLFSFNWEQVSGATILNAMGFTFFSLSLGAGIMVTYGSYLSSHTDIPGSSVWVAFLSTQAALLAGVMIIPAVFAFGMDPAAGTGLVFITIPMIFEHMPMADVLAAAFYVCLFIAAITSSVSLLEVVVAYLINEWGMRRRAATALCWITLFIFASLQALSFSSFSWVEINGMSLFDFSDYVCSNILMPLGGLSIAALAGWKAWPVMKQQMLAIRHHSVLTIGWIRLTISLLAPALVVIVLISGI
ncbi:sodium-dependent transporter [Parasutterella secunda]|jgi:transporter|uniref:sodium-dependent transporter n=1 Tax=Parasutterella secunda TaxID=626947 RepID=UPI0025A49CDC|nr:sodium-dependent transporter [Parasutterella secunda]MDM8224877.1 sodium-dependent transporter [Parasutterella secunda]HJI93714.1 sodium-dependent transporter [Sutterellaceae bacterium]